MQIFHWKKILCAEKNFKMKCSWQNFTNHFNLGNIIVNNICQNKITILNVHCKQYIYICWRSNYSQQTSSTCLDPIHLNFSKYLRWILHNLLKFWVNRNLTVFTPEFHILVLLPNLTQIQSLNNSLDNICHLVSPFSLPTLFFDGFALCIDLVHQRIVTRSTGSSVAAGGFGPGGVGNSSIVVAVCLAVECMGYSAGGHCAFGCPLLYFLQMGQFGPHPHFSFICFGATVAWGIAVLWGLCLNFYCGGRCRWRGNWSVLPGLEQVFWCWPCFRPWSVCSSRDILKWGGGLLSAEEPPWGGFSWNFPFAKFIIVICMDMGICMVMSSALGVGACFGLVTMHTLYCLVGSTSLLLSFVFVPLLTKGLVLGWMGLCWFWFCLGWGCCLGFWPISLLVQGMFSFFDERGCGWTLVLQGLHVSIWHILSLLNVWMPCIDVIFTSTSTVSTGKWHLKNPWRKLHSGCSMHAIWKMIYIVKILKLLPFLVFLELLSELIHFQSLFIQSLACLPPKWTK